MNRLYIRNIQDTLKSDRKSLMFLYYLQLRQSQKGLCGGFNIKQMSKALCLSDKSCRKALFKLTEYGYIKRKTKTYYRVVSNKKIIETSGHEKFIKLTDEELFSYSWKNISAFRALLTEVVVQTKVNARVSIHKKKFEIDRHGARTRRNTASDTLLMSVSFVSKMNHKSDKTITKYRRLQKKVFYDKKRVININSEEKYQEAIDSKGKFFIFKDKLVFVPIIKRFGKLSIQGY